MARAMSDVLACFCCLLQSSSARALAGHGRCIEPSGEGGARCRYTARFTAKEDHHVPQLIGRCLDRCDGLGRHRTHARRRRSRQTQPTLRSGCLLRPVPAGLRRRHPGVRHLPLQSLCVRESGLHRVLPQPVLLPAGHLRTSALRHVLLRSLLRPVRSPGPAWPSPLSVTAGRVEVRTGWRDPLRRASPLSNDGWRGVPLHVGQAVPDGPSSKWGKASGTA